MAQESQLEEKLKLLRGKSQILMIYLGGIMMALQPTKPQLRTPKYGLNLYHCLKILLEKVTAIYVFAKISNQIEKLQPKVILEQLPMR